MRPRMQVLARLNGGQNVLSGDPGGVAAVLAQPGLVPGRLDTPDTGHGDTELYTLLYTLE